MLKIINGIEITEMGNYHATVLVDGIERTFHINSRTFDDGRLNERAGEVIAQLRSRSDVQFYEYDENGQRRYANLHYHSNEVWQELLRDSTTRVFFFLWRLI